MNNQLITKHYKNSPIAELPLLQRYSLYECITVDNLKNFHDVSCRPITARAEYDMELISDIVTWGERFKYHWEAGNYCCSRCNNPLYSSRDKWDGPCVWPSFRTEILYDNTTSDYDTSATVTISRDRRNHCNNKLSISTSIIYPYNNYKVEVREVYCGQCDLFIGHQFADGIDKGDQHSTAKWRH